MIKRKRIFNLLLIISVSFLLISCTNKNKLLLLNWGEYINDDLVKKFEKENNVEVVISIADSNELFYSKVKSGTTVYDLVIPSDYMIEKMHEKDLISKIDYSKLKNYDENLNPYMPGVINILNNLNTDSNLYTIPYFWGTFGLMYNKNKEGLEKAIINYGWDAYFNRELLPNNTRIGMYNVSRYAYAAAMYYYHESANDYSKDLLNKAEKVLSNLNINEWGTDTLKKGIVANNLDLAFLYTGDYLDMLYMDLEDKDINEISYDIYIPDETIAFMDGFVIPKKSKNKDLAYKFIDFFLDPENAYQNASVVGYATPLVNSYNKIINYEGNDKWLNNWSYANKKYYPYDEIKGIPLKNFNKNILDEINQMINNVKIN